eukprot:GABW01004462.1.p2 GENE.GABW01004462.1~~GABW01004462.1.p2  ORF type:complete len:78 (-),score=5.30 GABW01004462.1:89-322(-)
MGHVNAHNLTEGCELSSDLLLSAVKGKVTHIGGGSLGPGGGLSLGPRGSGGCSGRLRGSRLALAAGPATLFLSTLRS